MAAGTTFVVGGVTYHFADSTVVLLPDTLSPGRETDDYRFDAQAEAAFARWADVYQPTTDGRAPVWAKRHPGVVNA